MTIDGKEWLKAPLIDNSGWILTSWGYMAFNPDVEFKFNSEEELDWFFKDFLV